MCCEFLLENVTWGWCLAFTNSLQLDKIKKAVKASVLDTITVNNTTYLSQLCLTHCGAVHCFQICCLDET